MVQKSIYTTNAFYFLKYRDHSHCKAPNWECSGKCRCCLLLILQQMSWWRRLRLKELWLFSQQTICKALIILINAAQFFDKNSHRSRSLRQKTDLRCQLAVVEQVLQWITTTEFIHQTWQVADNSWRIWGVNVARYITHLYHGDVPIGIKALRCRNLIREQRSF